ncbi:hypothetical protein BP00DRAFT_3551 [Aspergillus indologenus CBS 114.80]|uniref:Transmembrane protein n=1 Tax=Aspergillus indologenus CBS 114.80 TaxID=1450541 RepID=A0A2V5IJE3_9EURO|nr:hypothetical protein BP00DRAFT_3551 [Aspergillus indologenus CBS 114.80]
MLSCVDDGWSKHPSAPASQCLPFTGPVFLLFPGVFLFFLFFSLLSFSLFSSHTRVSRIGSVFGQFNFPNYSTRSLPCRTIVRPTPDCRGPLDVICSNLPTEYCTSAYKEYLLTQRSTLVVRVPLDRL